MSAVKRDEEVEMGNFAARKPESGLNPNHTSEWYHTRRTYELRSYLGLTDEASSPAADTAVRSGSILG